jgi:hypothetical protein
VGKTDAYGNSALLLAAERGHRHLIQLLIGQAHKILSNWNIGNKKYYEWVTHLFRNLEGKWLAAPTCIRGTTSFDFRVSWFSFLSVTD